MLRYFVKNLLLPPYVEKRKWSIETLTYLTAEVFEPRIYYLSNISGLEPAFAILIEEVFFSLFRHVVVALGNVVASDDNFAPGSDRIGGSVSPIFPVNELNVDPKQWSSNPAWGFIS